jgi:hypothetical protein
VTEIISENTAYRDFEGLEDRIKRDIMKHPESSILKNKKD